MPGPLNGIDALPLHPWIVASDAQRPVIYVMDTVQRRLLRTLELPGRQRPEQVVRFSPTAACWRCSGISSRWSASSDQNLQWLFDAELGDKPLDGCFTTGMEYMLVANENDATVSVVDIQHQRTLAHVPVGKSCEILAYYSRQG